MIEGRAGFSYDDSNHGLLNFLHWPATESVRPMCGHMSKVCITLYTMQQHAIYTWGIQSCGITSHENDR
jgi:hypothetical protein